MKKVSIFLMTLVFALCLFACDGCKKDKVVGKNNPTLNDMNSSYVSLKEGDFNYNITRGEMYLQMKMDNGATNLVNIIDSYLLNEYYKDVTNDDIVKAIDKDVYAKEEDPEKRSELEKTFLNTMMSSFGIDATSIYDEKIKARYVLTIAQNKYAKRLLLEEIKDNDEKYLEYTKLSDEEKDEVEDPVTSPYFADSKYATKYNNDHKSSYNVIVVPFATKMIATAALANANVEINENGNWANATTHTELTASEILAAYIKMYKSVYSYKDVTDKNSDEFNIDEEKINSVLLSYIKDMKNFNETTIDNDSFLKTPVEISEGAIFCYVLKLNENVQTKFDDLTDEQKEEAKKTYKDDLVESSLTASYVGKKLAELRKEQNLKIYDVVIENDYKDVISSYNVEYKDVTEEKGNVVASVSGKEFTCEDLFTEMEKVCGSSVLCDLLVQKRLIINSNLNTHYDSKTNTWTDTKLSNDMDAKIKEEEKNFNDGNYKDYGFDPEKMNFKSFLEGTYGVDSTEGFKFILLSEQVSDDLKNKLNYLEEYTTEKETLEDGTEKINYNFKNSIEDDKKSILWNAINNKMNKEADEYFNVTGVHVLISCYNSEFEYNEGSTGIDPEKWTDVQKEKAIEFGGKIKAYIENSKGTYKAICNKLIDAYNSAPVQKGSGTITELQNILSTNGTVEINLSEYKSYGLYLKYEDLGTFKNGTMVKAFNDKCKEIYDQDVADKVSDRVTVTDPICTNFGYHVYVNTASKALDYAVDTEDEKRYIPTLDEVRLYVSGQTSKMTTKLKNSITTYYTKYQDVIEGTYFNSVNQYKAVRELINSTNFTKGESCSYSSEHLTKYLNLYEDFIFENHLTSIDDSFIYKLVK